MDTAESDLMNLEEIGHSILDENISDIMESVFGEVQYEELGDDTIMDSSSEENNSEFSDGNEEVLYNYISDPV